MKKIKYVKRSGFRLQGDVQAMGRRLVKLGGRSGTLDAGSVVEDAKDPTSPLHGEFEWDVVKAAHAHWLEQARYVMRAIEIIYEEKGRAFQHRLFISLDEAPESYVAARRVLTDKQQREAWVNQALRELRSWCARYQSVKELSTIYEFLMTVTKKAA